jgi:Ca2+-binding RTX toxin-like protein
LSLVTIDLTPGTGFYQYRAQNDFTAIAYNVIIENAIGSSGGDVLIGNDAANRLDGRGGADIMRGGKGDDTYVVDNSQDVVTEGPAEGFDIVLSSASFALPVNVEGLTLLGNANISGTGNGLNNSITGNSGDNVLDGGAGADVLAGSAGNDTYLLDATDTVVENAEEGTDSVVAGFTYVLGTNVENLTLTGADSVNGTGNDLNNVLLGNSGVNVLTGGKGDDTYGVDNTQDVVVENPDEGIDTVISSVNYSLVNTSIENLRFTKSFDAVAIGNEFDNKLTGNSGWNELIGGAGDDVLDGGPGIDRMFGGPGNDTYVIDNRGAPSTGLLLYGHYGQINFDTPATFTPSTGVFDIVNLYDKGIYNGGDGIVDGFFVRYLEPNSSFTISITPTGFGQPVAPGQNLTPGIYSGGIETSFGGISNREHGTFELFSIDVNYSNRSSPQLRSISFRFDQDNFLPGESPISGVFNWNIPTSALARESITELVNEGNDTVFSVASIDLNSVANVENVTLTGSASTYAVGDAANNALIGNSGANTLTGGAGDDSLDGGLGNDVIDGGGSIDTVSYSSAIASVSVSLRAGVASGGAGSDVLTDIERLSGSRFNDLLIGNEGNNVIDGGLGNDTVTGGAGIDTVLFASAISGVSVNLLAGTANGGAGSDMLVEIENVTGSMFNDALLGDLSSNILDGGGGVDTALYTNAASGVVANLQTGLVTGGAGADTLISIENLTGSAFDDILTGDAGSNVLNGGAGDDSIVGGAGADTADYTGSAAGVTVSLALTGAQNTLGSGTDTLAEIENLKGSGFNDILTGNTSNNTLSGGAGNDVFMFLGDGNGIDTITDFLNGEDVIRFSGVNFTAPLTIGNGVAVGQGQAQLSSSGITTTLYIGTDLTPGADVTVTLAGNYTVNQLQVFGTDIAGNHFPTGSVAISGAAVLGQTLRVSNTLADTDGLGAISYQWTAGGVAINGATGLTGFLCQVQ